MLKVNLFDNNKGKEDSLFFIWEPCDEISYNYGYNKNNNITIFTDENMLLENINTLSGYKFGLFIEPACIKWDVYKKIEENYKTILNNFNCIFTHNDRLLKLDSKFVLLPFSGGSWILPEDRKIHNKSELVSIVVSQKMQAEGHRLRHAISKKYNIKNTFGPQYINLYNDYATEKGDTLRSKYNKVTGNLSRAFSPFMFNICVENYRQDDFFTEKILCCFETGTIPIYWGAKNIGNYFDKEGILTFETLEDLDIIISELNENLYLSKLSNVKNNFELSKKWKSYDSVLAKKIKEQI